MLTVRAKLTDWLWVAPLKSAAFAAAMESRGVSWRTADDAGDCDLDFVDSRFFAGEASQVSGASHKIQRPTIVFDGRDYLSTSQVARRLADRDDVLAIVKPQAYTSAEIENAPHYEETLFGAEMLGSMSWRQRPPSSARPLPEPITTAGFAKVVQFNNFVFSDHADRFDLKANNFHNRPIDVLFIGSARHYWGQTTRAHRAAAHEAIRRLPSDIVAVSAIGGTSTSDPRTTRFGHLPHRQAHFYLMQLSKIVVSPFGFSEVSTREIEAQLAGCWIIKPELAIGEFARTGPVDYWPGETTEFVDVWFSNLAEKVELILRNYRDIDRATRRWAEAAKRAEYVATLMGNVGVCADFYAQLLKGLA